MIVLENMIIREFTDNRKDTEEITRLMRKLCELKGQEFDEERWERSLFKKLKKNKDSEVIVAFNKETEEVIGMAQCEVRNSDGFRFGYISNLIVVEDKRRSGVGEALMRHSIEFFKRCHINTIRLALKSNLKNAAKILFKKLGFQETVSIYELKI